MRKFRLLALFTISILLAGAAQAATIRSATTASIIVGNEFGPCCDIGNAIDQSGLNGKYTSGVTDFDTYFGQNPLHNWTFNDQEYFAMENTVSGIVQFDLGSVYTLDRIALWNEDGAGIIQLDVLVSTNGTTFTEIVSDFAPTDHPPKADYPADIISLGGSFDAQYVRIDMNSCVDPSCSMGEIAFSTEVVPVPAAVWLFGSGLLGLIGISRRKKAV